MRALLSRTPGGPDTLKLVDLPTPDPGAGEVLMRTGACALNFPDTLIIRDLYQHRPERPFIPGTDVAGTVLRTGPGVADLTPGDRVYGVLDHGGLAEELVVPADRLTPIPDGLSDELAAAFLMTWRTAYHALHDRAAIIPGERLLVLGAGGGVGLAGVALGRALGARVTAAASSGPKLAAAELAGAHEILPYPPDPGAEDVRELAQSLKSRFPEGFDIVLDPVGGVYAEPALRRLRYGGRYLVVGFTAGIPNIPLNLPLLKSCQIVGVFLGAMIAHSPRLDQANTRTLAGMLQAGLLKPTATEILPLDRAAEALARIESRQAIGRYVVRF